MPVSDRSFLVRVDALTGAVLGFANQNRAPQVVLPENKGVVPAEAARDEFLKRNPLTLYYLWPEYFEQKAPAPYLVFMPEQGEAWSYIDAFTGKTVLVERANKIVME